jgi:hypothetical protein
VARVVIRDYFILFSKYFLWIWILISLFSLIKRNLENFNQHFPFFKRHREFAFQFHNHKLFDSYCDSKIITPKPYHFNHHNNTTPRNKKIQTIMRLYLEKYSAYRCHSEQDTNDSFSNQKQYIGYEAEYRMALNTIFQKHGPSLQISFRTTRRKF